MKKLITLFFVILLASCTTTYYQVYKTEPVNGKLTNDKIVFEDNNCIVAYHLWADGGNIGFAIYNKTEDDLVVDLTRTFFVLNGVAYEYFQNRTNSSSRVSYVQKPQIRIPAKTQVNIHEYYIANKRYVNCGLPPYPKSKTIKTVTFDASNSPFVFYNLISYKASGDSARMENRFYVNEITNYPSYEVFNKVDTSMCGRTLEIPKKVFKDFAPNNFYYIY